MTLSRLALKELTIAGDGVSPAKVNFTAGLNLFVGASDTGKTYILEALDFMLGAQDGLRRIPESQGYDRVFLSIDPLNQPPITLRRGIDGGQFELTEFADGRDKESTGTKILSPKHSADPDGSLSAYLLRAMGLSGHWIRKNAKGERRALSFRDIAHLTLIGEERIIQQTSPVTTGQLIFETAERNVFAFFMTGQDDSQIIPPEGKSDRAARLGAEETVVEAILLERQSELAALTSSSEDLTSQAAKLEATIREVSEAVVTSQQAIGELEQQRSALFEEKVRTQSRLGFLEEQLKRFRLLDSYYLSDFDRLQAVVEASQVVHELPEGACPLCNRVFTEQVDSQSSGHAEFEAACTSEVAKIEKLRIDLQFALQDSGAEERELRIRSEEIARELRHLDDRLQTFVSPAAKVQEEDLRSLIRQRTTIAQGETLAATIRSLQERLDGIRAARSVKVPKVTFDNRATTSVASEFCKVVEEILRAWKYPNLGTVSFDSDKADLVIGGQDRANKGKGYRAITYAAFALGLMKFCRLKDIPHPGFVVLDTPVNPFKGPTVNEAGDTLTDDVKSAFFDYLAKEHSGDQVIVLENVEPPAELRASVNYINFTKNPRLGRYGLFPMPTG